MTASRLISEEASGAATANEAGSPAGSGGGGSGGTGMTEFQRLPGDYLALIDKQQGLLKLQAEALGSLRKCETALNALVEQGNSVAPHTQPEGFLFNSGFQL